MSTLEEIEAAAAERDAWQLLNTFPEFRGLSTGEALKRLRTTLTARGPPLCFTISEFCDAHRISRSKLYQLWRQGAGPRVKRIGAKKLISAEAAREWRLAGEGAPTEQAV